MANLSMHVENQAKKNVGFSSPRRYRNRRTGEAYSFLWPYILVMLAFGLGPGIYAFLISFADYSTGLPRYFAAGINNYITVFKDYRFGFTFANIGEFLLISVPIGIALVVLLTLLLHMRPGRVASTLRTLFFIPGAAVGPAVVLLVIFMLTPDVSPFGFLLKSVGLKAFGDAITPASLPFIFLIMGFFSGAGMWIAIQYGALEGISKEVMEAATIDGCNEWQKALYIKLPLIQPYIIYQFILIFAGNVQLFVEPQLLGNQTYIHANVPLVWSPNQLAYSFAFDLGNFGASAALALIMLLIGLGASYLMIRSTGFFKIEN
jgi:multiple sugar transport system permease protein